MLCKELDGICLQISIGFKQTLELSVEATVQLRAPVSSSFWSVPVNTEVQGPPAGHGRGRTGCPTAAPSRLGKFSSTPCQFPFHCSSSFFLSFMKSTSLVAQQRLQSATVLSASMASALPASTHRLPRAPGDHFLYPCRLHAVLQRAQVGCNPLCRARFQSPCLDMAEPGPP